MWFPWRLSRWGIEETHACFRHSLEVNRAQVGRLRLSHCMWGFESSQVPLSGIRSSPHPTGVPGMPPLWSPAPPDSEHLRVGLGDSLPFLEGSPCAMLRAWHVLFFEVSSVLSNLEMWGQGPCFIYSGGVIWWRAANIPAKLYGYSCLINPGCELEAVDSWRPGLCLIHVYIP